MRMSSPETRKTTGGGILNSTSNTSVAHLIGAVDGGPPVRAGFRRGDRRRDAGVTVVEQQLDPLPVPDVGQPAGLLPDGAEVHAGQAGLFPRVDNGELHRFGDEVHRHWGA